MLSGRNDLSAHYASARADLQATLVKVATAESAQKLAQEQAKLAKEALQATQEEVAQLTSEVQVGARD